MTLHEFISRQSKPIVFGVYGAIGGLIGALLLGEPVWAMLKPPPPPPPEPRIVITASPSVEVYQSNKNVFTVQIARDLFDTPVEIQLADAPAGVTSEGLTIPAGETEGTLTIAAAPTAAAGSGTLSLSAGATSDSNSITSDTQLSVNVREFEPAKVDVMFVLDVTGSMDFAIKGVRDGVTRFAAGLSDGGLDFRVGLLAFRDERINEPSELLKFDGSVFTADVDGFRQQVSRLEAGGGDDTPESALDGLLESAAQSFRPEVTRVLLLITDAPPAIPDKSTQSMQHAIDSLKATGIEQLHLVVRQRHKAIYDQLWEASPGQYFDLDDVSGGGAAFARLMPELSDAIAEASISARPDQDASLSDLPPPAVIKGVQSDSQFDPNAKGQLIFAIACWTGVIAALISLILCGGQFYYLRSRLPALVAVAPGLGGGLVAGLVGGATGQGLFFLTPDIAIMDAVFRVLGWTLLGALAGFGLSFFIPNMRRHHGLGGGAIGGFVGALGYLAATQLGPGGEITGRVLGAVILGFCIGLMVALVESAFRSAWLEVWRGPKEMITVNLGPEPIRVGSDSRQCTVWAPEAPEIAMKYWIRQGEVICLDMATNRETAVPAGDRRKLGRVELVVRTGQDDRAATVTSTPPPPPPPAGVRPAARPPVAGAGKAALPRPAAAPALPSVPKPPLPSKARETRSTAPPPPTAPPRPAVVPPKPRTGAVPPRPGTPPPPGRTEGGAKPPPPPPPPPRPK